MPFLAGEVQRHKSRLDSKNFFCKKGAKPSLMAYMGDGVQPWAFRSASWRVSPRLRGRRLFCEANDRGTAKEASPKSLYDFRDRPWAGHTEERLLWSSPPPSAASAGALFPHELRAAITVRKPAHFHDSWEADSDSCRSFMRKCRAFLRTRSTGCFSFPQRDWYTKGIQCARGHPKHPGYWQSSELAYRTSYCWYWNTAGPHEDHGDPPPAFCL